jgi:hypothetical protein
MGYHICRLCGNRVNDVGGHNCPVKDPKHVAQIILSSYNTGAQPPQRTVQMTESKIETLVAEYNRKRLERLELNKKADALEKDEHKIKAELIAALKATGNTEFRSDRCFLQLKPKIKPVAEHWALVFKFIKDNDAFDILQKRLTETAVKARWDEGVIIPGINKFPVDDLSITTV